MTFLRSTIQLYPDAHNLAIFMHNLTLPQSLLQGSEPKVQRHSARNPRAPPAAFIVCIASTPAARKKAANVRKEIVGAITELKFRQKAAPAAANVTVLSRPLPTNCSLSDLFEGAKSERVAVAPLSVFGDKLCATL